MDLPGKIWDFESRTSLKIASWHCREKINDSARRTVGALIFVVCYALVNLLQDAGRQSFARSFRFRELELCQSIVHGIDLCGISWIRYAVL